MKTLGKAVKKEKVYEESNFKYVEGMAMCLKDSQEGINDISTPATITIECDFEMDGFCLCSCVDCDFYDSLSEKDADMLNGMISSQANEKAKNELLKLIEASQAETTANLTRQRQQSKCFLIMVDALKNL